MTTPETWARIGALERQLAAPTPAPLDGQTLISLTPDYTQEPLWTTPPDPTAPADRPPDP